MLPDGSSLNYPIRLTDKLPNVLDAQNALARELAVPQVK